MKYFYIDGDDIGLRIEKCFMDNNETNLMQINELVNNLVQSITEYIIGNNGNIIFSGADGIICKSKQLEADDIHKFIREQTNDITFSIGVGYNLNSSFLALRYAKANGKNTAFLYDKNFKHI
ncbi:MAG: hypothetical protein DRJ01_14240 [Bacteroidetes bacterium]|nr:MAG: hypothetical protein DRJ01_14240 [Bacteroidota bacterium]